MPIRTVLVALAFVQLAPGQSGQEKMKVIEQLVRTHVSWEPAANSGGLSVTLVETARNGDEFVYGLRATGTRPGALYQLYQWPVTKSGPVLSLDGVTFDETGLGICTGQPHHCGNAQQGTQALAIRMSPVMGEPMRIALADPKKGGRAYFQVTPIPIVAADKGCQLEATLISPHGAILYVHGSGFPANKKLIITSNSEGESLNRPAVATPSGEYRTMVLPGVVGKTSGVVKYTVSDGECSPTIESRWANEE